MIWESLERKSRDERSRKANGVLKLARTSTMVFIRDRSVVATIPGYDDADTRRRGFLSRYTASWKVDDGPRERVVSLSTPPVFSG